MFIGIGRCCFLGRDSCCSDGFLMGDNVVVQATQEW